MCTLLRPQLCVDNQGCVYTIQLYVHYPDLGYVYTIQSSAVCTLSSPQLCVHYPVVRCVYHPPFLVLMSTNCKSKKAVLQVYVEPACFPGDLTSAILTYHSLV